MVSTQAAVRILTKCRVCAGRLEEVFMYQPMPLVNDYCLTPDHECERYPLTLMKCNVCGLAQLREEIAPDVLYGGEYAYIPSTSKTMRDHFAQLASSYSGKTVLDIGSNDGTLLKAFKAGGWDVLGVDPAANLAAQATAEGVQTICGLFNEQMGKELGTFDLVVTTNTLANAHNIPSILNGVRECLSDDGWFVVETPDLKSLIEIGSYDSVYHEHMAYFTEHTLVNTLGQYRFQVEQVERFPIHGGLLRVTARKVQAWPRMGQQLNYYADLPHRVSYMSDRLHVFLRNAWECGQRVVGYGAPAKATVLLNQADIKSEWIDFLTDTIPYKQGKYLPGLHIPIRHPDELGQPDYVLLLAWNFRDECLEKLSAYRERGGQVIIPVPELEVL